MKARVLKATTIAILICFLFNSCEGQYKSSPRPDIFLNETHYPGFIKLNDKSDIFYWLFESRKNPSTAPLVIWLTGGPGCSSQLALFTQNGPYWIRDDLQLEINQHSWNNNSNLLFIDQPVGTGFSKAALKDYTYTEKQIAGDFYLFLENFLTEFPQFIGRPIYITGESYAGHYIPAIAAFILQQKNPSINLKGLGIGNGWVDPYYQYPQYAEFTYQNKLISQFTYTGLKIAYKLCQASILSKIWILSTYLCQLPEIAILGFPLLPRFNVYDIRKKCEHPPLCYDLSSVKQFLARKDVIEALGVEGRKWSECNQAVHTFLIADFTNRFSQDIKYVLDQKNVNVLVYSGDKDYICNWRGGEAWTKNVKWDKKEQFAHSPYYYWTGQTNSTDVYGEIRRTDQFAFLRVYDAGHMVPMDQPQRSQEMLDRLIAWEW